MKTFKDLNKDTLGVLHGYHPVNQLSKTLNDKINDSYVVLSGWSMANLDNSPILFNDYKKAEKKFLDLVKDYLCEIKELDLEDEYEHEDDMNEAYEKFENGLKKIKTISELKKTYKKQTKKVKNGVIFRYGHECNTISLYKVRKAF